VRFAKNSKTGITIRMIIDEILSSALAVLAGTGLGTAFFGGLWWTVQKGVRCKNPAFLFFFSFVLRASFVLIGVFLVGGTQPVRILFCLFGFTLGRFLVGSISRRLAGGKEER